MGFGGGELLLGVGVGVGVGDVGLGVGVGVELGDVVPELGAGSEVGESDGLGLLAEVSLGLGLALSDVLDVLARAVARAHRPR